MSPGSWGQAGNGGRPRELEVTMYFSSEPTERQLSQWLSVGHHRTPVVILRCRVGDRVLPPSGIPKGQGQLCVLTSLMVRPLGSLHHRMLQLGSQYLSKVQRCHQEAQEGDEEAKRHPGCWSLATPRETPGPSHSASSSRLGCEHLLQVPAVSTNSND